MRDQVKPIDEIREDTNPAAPLEDTFRMDRREFVAGLLASLITSGCNEEPAIDLHAEEAEYVVTPSVEVVVDESIQIPISKLLDKRYTIPKPGKLRISDEEYRDILSKKIPDFLRAQLIPKLKSNPNNPRLITGQVLEELMVFLSGLHPEFAKDLLDFNRTWDHKFTSLRNHLNRTYFLPGGYYLLLITVPGAKSTVNFFPIEKTDHVEVGDDLESIELPVLHMGEGLIPENIGGKIGNLGGVSENVAELDLLFVWPKGAEGITHELLDGPKKGGEKY